MSTAAISGGERYPQPASDPLDAAGSRSGVPDEARSAVDTLPPLDRAGCEALDRADPLARRRDAFAIPPDLVYLVGHSLGPLPRQVPQRVARVVAEEWGKSLVGAWNDHGWFSLPQRVGDRIARLVGAPAGSVVAADTISVNVFKLLAAAARLVPSRRVILSDSGNFPSDLYVAQGFRDLVDDGWVLRVVEPEDLSDAIGDTVALVLATDVDYRTARRHDMAAVTAKAHAAGALVLWDLAHSAGATTVDLEGSGADFAVGCTYKYLCGGPGAPAFLYVRPDLQESVVPALAGWWGHAAPFAFEPGFRPAPGILRLQCGTQPILSLAALDAALDVWDDVDPRDLRDKAAALVDAFVRLVMPQAAAHGIVVEGPREAARRGAHVSLRHPEGYAIVQALAAAGVAADFRAPDLMRFGLAPLVTRFVDLWDAADRLRGILDSRGWDEPRFQRRKAVT